MKRFEYLPSGSELKNGIPKDQYKLFRDKMNFIYSNREDGVKTENGVKAKDIYIGNKYEDLINNVFSYE